VILLLPFLLYSNNTCTKELLDHQGVTRTAIWSELRAWRATMSRSSTSDDAEKDLGFENEKGRPFDQEQHEDLAAAEQPAFTVHDDIEKSPVSDSLEEDSLSLKKIQSEKPSVNNIKSVPNGGGIAWLQVLCSFFVFFNTWGIINAFGIYQGKKV
jgi:hypothetical protein